MPQKGFTNVILIFGGVILVVIGLMGGAFLVNLYGARFPNPNNEKDILVPNKTSPLPIHSSAPALISKPEKVANNPDSCTKQNKLNSPLLGSAQSGMTLEEAKRIMPLYPAGVTTKVKEGKILVEWPGTGEGGLEYIVCRRTTESSNWQVVAEVKIAEDNRGDYSFEDTSIKSNFTYIYGIRFRDIYENYSQITEGNPVTP